MKFVISIWLGLASLLSAGGLVFPEPIKELSPGLDDTKVVADFQFTNKDNKPVIIDRASGGCSCLAVQIADGKKVYAPGESGVIRVNFDMGNFWGTVDKPISVWMAGDSEASPSHVVTLRVHVPVLIDVEPKTARWEVAEPGGSKTIQIKMSGEKPIHVTAVKPSTEDFNYELKTIEDGKAYSLVVTPKSTDKQSLAIFRIETDCEITRHSVQQAFAVVRNPASKSPAPGALPPGIGR